MYILSLLLVVYIIGIFVIGVPMGNWSLRLWRNRDGKKSYSLAFLFPLNYFRLCSERQLHHEIGTYWYGQSLLHDFVSEDALLNGIYDKNTESQLACARYVFVSAFTWPLRCAYVVIMAMFISFGMILQKVFAEWLPTLGGKLLLRCGLCLRNE